MVVLQSALLGGIVVPNHRFKPFALKRLWRRFPAQGALLAEDWPKPPLSINSFQARALLTKKIAAGRKNTELCRTKPPPINVNPFPQLLTFDCPSLIRYFPPIRLPGKLQIASQKKLIKDAEIIYREIHP